MNIPSVTSDGAVFARPDTTKAKVGEDIFLPEFVTELSISPVVYLRLTRPGRSVERRFASRYYDAVTFGAFLYPENIVCEGEAGFASANCLDHTSIMSAKWFEPVCVEGELLEIAGKSFRLPGAEALERAIETATRYVYIRTGDLLALELAPRTFLCSQGQRVRVEVKYKEEILTENTVVI